MLKTAVYTKVNDNIVRLHNENRKKLTKMILLNNTMSFGDVFLGNITFV